MYDVREQRRLELILKVGLIRDYVDRINCQQKLMKVLRRKLFEMSNKGSQIYIVVPN